MTKTFRIAVGIFQVVGYILGSFTFYLGEGVEEAKGGVTFRSSCQIQGRMGKMVASFRHAHAVKACGCRFNYSQGVGICYSYILGGGDKHTTEDKVGILPRMDHPGKPVESGIRVAAAQRFDEGADNIKVVVPLFIV